MLVASKWCSMYSALRAAHKLLVLVIAPLGGMLLVYKPPTYRLGLLLLIYSPNCYEVNTVYINSLLSDQGRAV